MQAEWNLNEDESIGLLKMINDEHLWTAQGLLASRQIMSCQAISSALPHRIDAVTLTDSDSKGPLHCANDVVF